MDVLMIIFQILFWLVEINVLYYAILYIVGIFFHRVRYKMQDDKEKFCIFVPCHNEGAVVEATVKDYININYNKDLYDIYFIADNCSDNTAEVLRKAIKETGATNFYVLERNVNDPKKRGKPHALRWGIEQLEKEDKFYSKYDMFMILDADNFVDADILKHVNSQYLSYKENKRPVMIQTYLDSKNKNSLVARGYFENYRIMNGFWQISKQKLHLVPGIGGTGFAIDTTFLKSIGGFNCKSLTEDLEIETIATIKNKKIVYNPNVRIYDEKPTRLKASIVQRTRWAQGHWYIAFKYIPLLFIQLFNPKSIKMFFKKLDMLMYLASRFFIVWGFLMTLISLYYAIVSPDLIIIPHPFGIVNTVLLVLSILLIPLASLYDGKPKEKKRVLIEFIPNVISIYLITAIDIITSIMGLCKCGNQKTWKKTVHKINTITEGKFEHTDNNGAVAECGNSGFKNDSINEECKNEIQENTSSDGKLVYNINTKDNSGAEKIVEHYKHIYNE